MAQHPAPSQDEHLQQMLIAGGRYDGRPTQQAAIHLLTFTELVHHRGFADLLDTEDVELRNDDGELAGQRTTAAFVRDWAALPNSPTAGYMSGGSHRLLALAVALATGEPVNLIENLPGLGSAHARRVIEAITIATGTAHLYEITGTAALQRMRDERDALFNS
jgi:hypothetical protein